ncbi:hypothetical protein HAX54_027804 [Datura stramonium]|uniref:Secreted protein n=1 Tax=Datura stramonium TaxID=4076 RepID=A0ABS8V382_DATST|nr:hypothetical protein [Datura stramonium]
MRSRESSVALGQNSVSKHRRQRPLFNLLPLHFFLMAAAASKREWYPVCLNAKFRTVWTSRVSFQHMRAFCKQY